MCRFLAKDAKMYFKDYSNIIDIIMIWPAVANLYVRNDSDVNFYFRRIFNAIAVAF